MNRLQEQIQRMIILMFIVFVIGAVAAYEVFGGISYAVLWVCTVWILMPQVKL